MAELLHYRASGGEPHVAVAAPWTGDPLGEGRHWHAAETVEGWGAGHCIASGEGAAQAWPWCEVGVIEAGELVLECPGERLRLNAGEAFVIPHGTVVKWQASAGLQYCFMAVMTPAEQGRAPLRLDLGAPLQPCAPPSAEVLLGPAPKAWSVPLYEAGDLRVGLWQCEAYARREVRPTYTELMYLLEGGMQLAPEHGLPVQVEAREVIVAPAGLANAWASERVVRKVYCIWS